MSVMQLNSIFNLGSIGFPKQNECLFEEMTDAELREALKNIAYSTELLRLENDVYERYLARRDPDSLNTITQILETAKRVQRIAPQQSYTSSPVMSVSGSVTALQDRESFPSVISIQSSLQVTPSVLTHKAIRKSKITYAQRTEMVNTEIRTLQEELVNLEQTSRKKKIYLQAQMEESEISSREIRKTTKEFEEEVVEKGVDSITGKIPAEKFMRFIEEWFKMIDIEMERIRLKIITLKSQIVKVKFQLQQRREFGEALRIVDFEQLHIENKECMKIIEEKNLYLLKMKKVAGQYSITLTKHKQKLNSLISTINEVKNKIVSKSQEIIKLKSDEVIMKVEIEKMKEQLNSVVELMENFQVPRVIDFVQMRAELQELHGIHKQLTRQKMLQRILK